MVSLIIYIASFVVIIAIVAGITTFFNHEVRNLSGDENIRSEYNKFNLYMLEYTKNGYEVQRCGKTEDNKSFVTFLKKDGKSDTFVQLGDILYFNQIKLCENIEEFEVEQSTAENGKEVLRTYLKIGGMVYSTEYVME